MDAATAAAICSGLTAALLERKSSDSRTLFLAGGQIPAILFTHSSFVMYATSFFAISTFLPLLNAPLAAWPITGTSPSGPAGIGAMPHANDAEESLETLETC